MAAIARSELRVVVNPILVGGFENRAAGDIAPKGIRLPEQRIEHKEATRRIALQAAIRGNGAIVCINKRDHLLRQGIEKEVRHTLARGTWHPGNIEIKVS